VEGEEKKRKRAGSGIEDVLWQCTKLGQSLETFPHFLQQRIRVFLEDKRSGMGIAESLLGTTDGFSVKWLSLAQFSLILK